MGYIGRMKVWGITGLKGTGKSELASHFASLGCPTVNVEEISRKLINKDTEEGREGFQRIYKIFGSEVLNSLGQLDPGKMAKKLMLNPHDKQRIEEAIDPLINDAIEKKRVQWKQEGVKLAFVDGSRIFEAGLDKSLSGVIALEVDFDKRVKRVVKKEAMEADQVKLMFQMQDNDVISRLAKTTWKNNGKLTDLKKKADAFVDEVKNAEA